MSLNSYCQGFPEGETNPQKLAKCLCVCECVLSVCLLNTSFSKINLAVLRCGTPNKIEYERLGVEFFSSSADVVNPPHGKGRLATILTTAQLGSCGKL